MNRPQPFLQILDKTESGYACDKCASLLRYNIDYRGILIKKVSFHKILYVHHTSIASALEVWIAISLRPVC
jgi:hypothetical protein